MVTDEQIKKVLSLKGINYTSFCDQLESFKKGFPFLKISSAAGIGNGINSPGEEEKKKYIECWHQYLSSGKTVIKFVPASGAASRMFKDLFAFLSSSENNPTTDFEKHFFSKLTEFAFYKDLNAICYKNEGLYIEQLIEEGKWKTIIENLLLPKGLNYGNLPKGLLKFHIYDTKSRTPIEEHMMEGALYAKTNKDNKIRIHFTVSPEHRLLFENLIAEKKIAFEKYLNAHYSIGFSTQKESTDTVAVGLDNEPFVDNSEILFRPGGHGSLIENLNDLDADIVFIKNIDNVVPDRLKEYEARYKKLLAGILIHVQTELFRFMEILEHKDISRDEVDRMMTFAEKVLHIQNSKSSSFSYEEKISYLRYKFNRPSRVCGMVKNVGEPGGGPFFAENHDGTYSLQILESSQINMNDSTMKDIFLNGTHFNPVDLVCALKNYKGEKFDLKKYVDPKTGFISEKSKNGKVLKALEHPGLWNGAMSDWNTIFVEVPIQTFNPVKTVNDLLRDAHLP